MWMLRTTYGVSGLLAMGHSMITDLADSNRNEDSATNKYVDAQDNLQVAKTGDTMSGALAMGGSKITDLTNPISGLDAATK